MKFDKFKQFKVTSVKCNQPPGGASNFSLGLDNNYLDNLSKKNLNHNNIGVMYNTSILKELNIKFDKRQENLNVKERSISTNNILSTNSKQNKPSDCKIVDYKNVYKPGSDNKLQKTSVKVSNAPGGRSNISLGFYENGVNKMKK